MLTFDEYSKNYENKLNEFLQNCPDATELDFIEKEYEKFQYGIYEYENSTFLLDAGIKLSADVVFDNKSKFYTYKKILTFLDDKINNIKSKKEIKKRKNLELNLQDVLVKNSNEDIYAKIEKFLTKERVDIEGSFVTILKGKLNWNKKPIKGWQLYLSAFYYKCLKNNWILDKYSSTDYVIISKNTFNINPDNSSFKNLSSKTPNEKYSKAFKDLK
jgi:hypothetical protein